MPKPDRVETEGAGEQPVPSVTVWQQPKLTSESLRPQWEAQRVHADERLLARLAKQYRVVARLLAEVDELRKTAAAKRAK